MSAPEMPAIELRAIQSQDWCDDDPEASTFRFDGAVLNISDFQAIDNAWTGRHPLADWFKANRVYGIMPRGAGNSDPWAYVLGASEYGGWAVALIDTSAAAGPGAIYEGGDLVDIDPDVCAGCQGANCNACVG